ncbi:MAG: M20 family metallopeptidase [Candidatus Methanomethylicia archaeon]
MVKLYDKNDVLKWVNDNSERFVDIAQKIWEYAEPALQEYKSSKLLADELEKDGFVVKRNIGGMPTAFVASYGSGKPVIGILGEYDALPGLSQKAVPYREPVKEGMPGHGCGHNLLGTASFAAALAVKHFMDIYGLRGTVRFYGCPAEEILVGKVYMAKAGAFDDLDVALTWHPWIANTVWMASMLAMNNVKFKFYGIASHAAASPQAGRSALDAVELMNVGVNYLREHIIPDARIHYVITHGGQAPNIVPDYAEAWYFVRAPKRAQVEEIYNRVLNIARGAALMTDTRLEIEFITGCWEVIPNKLLSDLLYKNLEVVDLPKYTSEELKFAEEIIKSFPPTQREALMSSYSVPRLEEALKRVIIDYVAPPEDIGKILPGSTDVGDVSSKIPTAQLVTSTWVSGTPSHSWQAVATSGMSIGYKGMLMAAKALALTTIDLFLKTEAIEKAWEEHRKKGIVYKSPLPEGAKPPLPKI